MRKEDGDESSPDIESSPDKNCLMACPASAPGEIPEADFEENGLPPDENEEAKLELVLKNSSEEGAKMIKNPQGWLQHIIQENEITGIIFFRGAWCIMDGLFMRKWNAQQRDVMSKNGCKLYAVCSQDQSMTNKATKAWKLSSFHAVIGDPTNQFSTFVRSNVDLLPELFIADCSKIYHPFLKSKNYPSGATQPAIFFFVGTKPVLGWCKHPTMTDLYGGLERPDPAEAWKEIERMKEHAKKGKSMPISNGDEIPVSVTCREVFCTIL